MPNQLPKNQNPNSFKNEKHLNLLDNIPNLEQSQNERITNFILFISIFLSIVASLVTYLNLNNSQKFTPPSETIENIEFIKSKETFTYEVKKVYDYLKRYQAATNSIKIKQSIFYEETSKLLSYLGNPNIESLEFTQENNLYKFKIIFFFKNQDIEKLIKEFETKNNKFSNLKLESLEKIDENNQYKITYTGDIDGR